MGAASLRNLELCQAELFLTPWHASCGELPILGFLSALVVESLR